MRTYRLYLIGEADGVIYGIKEYEADSEASAAAMAEGLIPAEGVWGGQRLIPEFQLAERRA